MRLSLACSPGSVRAPPNNPNRIQTLHVQHSAGLVGRVERSVARRLATRKVAGFAALHPPYENILSRSVFMDPGLAGSRRRPGMTTQLTAALSFLCVAI